MFPNPNPLRQHLNTGRSIHGLYIQMPWPDGVEIAAAAGYDYVIIDEEHGSFDFAQTIHMIRAAESRGIAAIVRVPDHSPARIRKALEAGAVGVYVPDIRTQEQAAAAVAAIKFGVVGAHGRGACPTVRATGSGAGGAVWGEFVHWNDRNVLVCLLIESRQGMENLDAILSVPGVDVAILGRFDLAHEMGIYGDRYGKTMNDLFEGFVTRCQGAGVHYVTRLTQSDPDLAQNECEKWLARGARIFNVGSDRELVARAFRDALRPFTRAQQQGCHSSCVARVAPQSND